MNSKPVANSAANPQLATDHRPLTTGPATNPRRLAANRANAAKSTGPKTDAGKAASSRNAVQHGLSATKFILANEDIHECRQLRDDYINRFLPRDQVEMDLVDRMAHATWTLRRCWTMSNELMNLQMLRMEAQLAAEYDNFPERTRTASAFETLASQPALALLNRYEARLSSEYQRALRTLLELRKSIPVGPASPAEPDRVPEPATPESEPNQTNPICPDLKNPQPESAAPILNTLQPDPDFVYGAIPSPTQPAHNARANRNAPPPSKLDRLEA